MGHLLLVSGFGPFEKVDRNASGELARALADRPPRGAEVQGAVLPVSFDRAPTAWDEVFDGLPRLPDLILGLGVQKRPFFRLERRARGRLRGMKRVDVDGVVAARSRTAGGGERRSPVDLDRVADALRRAGADRTVVSERAGGYVCERIYHHLLGRAAEHGIPGLFLHVPPADAVPVATQARILRVALAEL